MGFLKDLKQLNDTGRQLQKQSGMQSGFAGMKQAVSNANAMLSDVQQNAMDAAMLTQNGTDAAGYVRTIRATGMQINHLPEIEFELDVAVAGQPAYRVTHRQVISPVNIPAVQPGATVALKTDGERVLIVGF